MVFHQPLWKICGPSNWIISPGIGVKIQKYLSCHHPENNQVIQSDLFGRITRDLFRGWNREVKWPPFGLSKGHDWKKLEPEINYYLMATNSSPLKMDGWNTIVSFWGSGLFSGAFAVSFRECTSWIVAKQGNLTCNHRRAEWNYKDHHTLRVQIYWGKLVHSGKMTVKTGFLT